MTRDTDRDNFMDANEALKYGLVDKIFEKRELKTKVED
jgi:ATP-dependent Clp protease protease subunit